MIGKVGEKTKEELLQEFCNRTSHNTLDGEQYTAAIIVKSAAAIENSADSIKQSVDLFRNSVENASINSERISRKLFWLNVVLAIATSVGALATAALIFKET